MDNKEFYKEKEFFNEKEFKEKDLEKVSGGIVPVTLGSDGALAPNEFINPVTDEEGDGVAANFR